MTLKNFNKNFDPYFSEKMNEIFDFVKFCMNFFIAPIIAFCLYQWHQGYYVFKAILKLADVQTIYT